MCVRHSRGESKYAYSVSLDSLWCVPRYLLPNEQHDFVIISYPCFPLLLLFLHLVSDWTSGRCDIPLCLSGQFGLIKCTITVRSVRLMGKPCKRPRRNKKRVKSSEAGSSGREFGCKMSHLFVDDAIASGFAVGVIQRHRMLQTNASSWCRQEKPCARC